MNRFRFTLLAVCLLLIWLGYTNLQIHFRNRAPLTISAQQLEQGKPPREWLNITGGNINILEAINMKGTMEIDALLVPLRSAEDKQITSVWVETRNPQIIDLWKTYYFKLDTELQQNKFVEQNKAALFAQRDVIGMTADFSVASNNQAKLEELLLQLNVPTSENTVFISEGKEPKSLSGYFFAIIGVIGLVKVGLSFRSKPDLAAKTEASA